MSTQNGNANAKEPKHFLTFVTYLQPNIQNNQKNNHNTRKTNMPISLNVNIDKIDKNKFFKGKKGRYLDLILFETPDSDYGDYLVKQRGDKDEKMPILGNGKYFAPKNGATKKGNTDADKGTDQPAGKDPW
jgi:hypothetical protein